jgi:hypothetical protein
MRHRSTARRLVSSMLMRLKPSIAAGSGGGPEIGVTPSWSADELDV